MVNSFVKRILLPVVVVITVAGCATQPNIDTSASPTSATSTESSSPDVLEDYVFYFVGETLSGFRLFQEVHQVSASENELGDDKGLNALVMLVDGQLPPFDGDHKTLWNNGTKINGVTRLGDTATVDLQLGRISFGSETEQRAIDQIVWTLTANDPTITSVNIIVDGKPIESIAGHVDATKAFTRGLDYEVLASVWIDLLDKSDLVSPVTISGSACTFEANVAWELSQGDAIVQSGATTAKTACPDRSEWTIDLGTLAVGDYTLRVFDTSAQDGTVISEDTKDFVVLN
ncbi:unannotated protein [freshwater metagenome]|uniref:Unannotated protein n=1 Tax=freshwater metagenome TaxID=449393 RepID=A0A6J7C179_9ZZZZ|nr:hypothetical protein [Actinomycetota bacterium]MSW25321.1 hypothetical protein [Actinomycetota bacterium]MSX29858.1 hypothetical protein [Actinomycetota bacterium]MSX43974.1 hypothetical protein [Actinomycetota bacterium]MSX96932.1 hypothetical protein [Actinomycetota bacterium]